MVNEIKEDAKKLLDQFRKHLENDDKILGKFEIICDLLMNQINEFEPKILKLVENRRALVIDCVKRLHPSPSHDSDGVPSLLEIGDCPPKIREFSDENKKKTKIVSEDSVHVNAPNLVGDGIEIETLNLSGIWTYRKDETYKFVLEEDSDTGEVTGFELKNNQRRLIIRGQRKLVKPTAFVYRLYQLSKLFADGRRCVQYTVQLNANGVDLDITKMGTDMTKPMRLSTKIIPQQFQDELVWCNHTLKKSTKSIPQHSQDDLVCNLSMFALFFFPCRLWTHKL